MRTTTESKVLKTTKAKRNGNVDKRQEMKRQNVIVVIAPTIEVWGNFRKLCVAKGFDVLPYHSLKSKPFPIIYKDWIIHKVQFL